MTTSTEDFATLLEESFKKQQPERGDIVAGTVLAVDSGGILVDVGLKSDGVVPWTDIDRADSSNQYAAGDTVHVMIMRDDIESTLIVSIAHARQLEDWIKAEQLMQDDEAWQGHVVDANKGGVIVEFGHLRGFVPASHVVGLPRELNEDDRRYELKQFIGREITCKVLEVDRKRRRLVLSEREAQREQREQRKDALIESLNEGDIINGVISGMRDFGAFVDLGGADGLIHISELAWHRVNHPREVVSSRQEVEVYILRLDRENKRIELSLKRLQPNPWEHIEEKYYIGQLITGEITRNADFGTFVVVEPGVEGLLHINHLPDPVPEHPSEVLTSGDTILLRVISLDSNAQRLGLSMRDVTQEEWAEWQANQLDPGDSEESSLESEVEEAPEEAVSQVEEVSELPETEKTGVIE